MRFPSAAAALCLFITVPAAGQQAPALPPDLDAYVTRVMREFGVPGVSLAVVKDGRISVYYGGSPTQHLGWKRSGSMCVASVPGASGKKKAKAWLDRLVVVYDLSTALEYLHSQK